MYRLVLVILFWISLSACFLAGFLAAGLCKAAKEKLKDDAEKR